MSILLIQVRLAGFPAEAAEHRLAGDVVPDLVGATADTVAIGVVRIGVGQQGGFGNGFQQAQADHGRRHAGGEQGVRVHLAIAELADRKARLAQLDGGAIGEGHRYRLVTDPYLAFRLDAGDGHVLQLAAVDRFRHHAQAFQQPRVLGGGVGRDRQAHQHGHGVIRAGRRRMATAVLHVAVLAGVGVEQRAQAIACGGGGGGDHPGVAEEAVADAEVQPAHRREIGRGHGEGVLVELAHGRRATGQMLAGFGLGEPRRVVTGTEAEGQQQGRQAANGRWSEHWRVPDG
ncbi:hypothetical protein D3C84_423960 [compost metagenome]